MALYKSGLTLLKHALAFCGGTNEMLLSVDVLFRRELILLCQLIRKKTIATCAGLLEIHGFNETTSYKIIPRLDP